MESRNPLNTIFTLVLTACLVLEMVARVVFLGSSLLAATLSFLLVGGTAALCLWYTGLSRTIPLTRMALLCRIVVTTQVVLTAKDLVRLESLPLLYRLLYAVACLSLSVVTAFILERDLRLVLEQNHEK
ncbi:hypothetical protein [Armatimonas rosea]|uniref:Uncharacterized protein n=1 Tax=Armatimonas rosea TaxID=685828 RepID=A0A7W9SU63_ARMRO|nr:hypothetical protein [Armatimonas rosea]MBB6052284.1 hypothetical protein [Armatimonas rosea]